MNCTSFIDMNNRINVIESKVNKIHLCSLSKYIYWSIPTNIYSINNMKNYSLKSCMQTIFCLTGYRCVSDLLLLFQIKLLEEGRSSLPTANSLPEGSTHNEVDTPQPTPIGPPPYLPPGINISHAFRNR